MVDVRLSTFRFIISLILIFGVHVIDDGHIRSAEASETTPIFYVDARGKTGNEIGVELGNSIKAQFPDIELKLDGYLAYFFGLIASDTGIPAQTLFDSFAVPRINAIKPNIDKRYRDEVNALASGLALSNSDSIGDGHLSSNEIWALELVADIARETNCSGFGVFGNYASTDSPVVGRNLDWHTNEGMRSLQAITVYHYDDRTFVNIGFAGFAGVLTGFNSDGLFAGILDSPMDDDYPHPPSGKRSYVFDLRNALESYTTISGAANALYSKPYAFSHNILFADTTDVQVLEHPQGAYGQLRTAQSQLNNDISWGKSNQIAVVNFFVLEGYSNQRYPFNTIRWNRLRELATFNTSQKAAANDIKSIMLDTTSYPYSIFSASTVQSMVFVPVERKLFLYRVPASGIHHPTPTMNEVSILLTVIGDINSDREVDLRDAILALQVMAGINTSIEIYKETDVNGDERIGLEEAVYVLQVISGLRVQ